MSTQLASTLEPELLAMLVQQVIVEPVSGSNNYGEPEYGSPQTWPCLTFALPVATLGKEEIVTTVYSMLFAPPDCPIAVGDRVTMPDGSQPPVLGVQLMVTELGPHHIEAYVGHAPSAYMAFGSGGG